MRPRYPNIRVRLRSRHPLAAVSAIRHALRRSGVERDEIRRFTDEALAGAAASSAGENASGRISSVCTAWARVIVEHEV